MLGIASQRVLKVRREGRNKVDFEADGNTIMGDGMKTREGKVRGIHLSLT